MSEIIKQDTSTLESVNYRVVRNGAASKVANHDVYTGIVDVKETYNLAAIAKRMVAEGCPLNTQTVRLVLSNFAELTAKLVAEGRAVTIPGLVRFSPAIRGTFDSADAEWNASQHQVVVNASIGSRMRTAAAKSTVERVNAVVLPVLEKLLDMATAQANVITSQGTFMVSGARLTWDVTAEDEGWFLNRNGVESKCEPVESVQDPECAVLRTTESFDIAGLPLELFFRTRIDGGLRQVKYGEAIVTAVAQ